MQVNSQLINAQLEHTDDTQTPFAAGRVTYNKDCKTAFIDTGTEIHSLQDNRHDPIGTIKIWPGDTPPDFHVLTNGQALSRTTYAKLFSVIGVIYGNGDGVNTFNVPDYRGRFLRSTDQGRNLDPEAATRSARPDGTVGDFAGTTQGQAVIDHRHIIFTHQDTTGGGYGVTGNNTPATNFINTASGPIVGTGAGGIETRPKNISVNFIIKVK